MGVVNQHGGHGDPPLRVFLCPSFEDFQ
jgi:hypothetical protein